MKTALPSALIALAALVGPSSAAAIDDSPVGKVLSMLSDLQAKIIKEGEVVQKEYAAFAEWCEDRSRNLEFEIKTGKAEAESLQASINEDASTITALTAKVEETAAGVATDEADLKAASEIRAKEQADFAAEEKELVEIIDMLARATAVLEREMKRGGASMMQLTNAGNVVQVLSAMVQASLIGSADASKLTAFVQDAQQDQDGEEQAPAAAVYESHSANIVDTLQDLSDKAEAQLDDARKKEVAAAHNYDMLKQSLEDEIKFANKELDEAQKGIAGARERKAKAEGELGETQKEVAADIETEGTLHHDCMTKSSDFEVETKSRGEELEALATAKKVIEEAMTSGGALVQVSFLQVERSQLSSRADLASFEAVRLVRDLARRDGSASLAQLASRMASAMRNRGGAGDPFEKVRGMIKDMITKLEQEAAAESTKKAFCDKELKETEEKKADKSEEVESLTTKLDRASAKSGQLKEEVARLEEELALLAKSQAEMDKLRAEQKETYTEAKAEVEKGLDGLKTAIRVLKEYYGKTAAHNAAVGAGGGIIALLETVESDFAKNLAEIVTEEESAVSDHDEMSRANDIERTAKEQDIKYKVKASKDLDKEAAELTSDRTGVQAELDAVLEYLARMQDECIAKPEAYEERTSRRDAEIAGLKQALQTLENETALVQRHASRRTLRGGRPHGAIAA